MVLMQPLKVRIFFHEFQFFSFENLKYFKGDGKSKAGAEGEAAGEGAAAAEGGAGEWKSFKKIK